MKRIAVALSFAVLSAHAIAADPSAPFEQDQFDRQLPTLTSEFSPSSGGSSSREPDFPPEPADAVWPDDFDSIAPAQ